MLGIIVGDGYVSRYFVEISDQYYENLVVVKQCIENIGYKAVITRDPKEDRYRLWINNKAFVEYIYNLGYRKYSPPIAIEEAVLEEKLAFVRGLFDAEGYIEYWKPRRMIRINLSNKSIDIINFARDTLVQLRMNPYIRFSSKTYRLQIYRKADVEEYIKQIGFTYPQKIRRLQTLLMLTKRGRPQGGGLKLKGIGGGAPQGVEPAV